MKEVGVPINSVLVVKEFPHQDTTSRTNKSFSSAQVKGPCLYLRRKSRFNAPKFRVEEKDCLLGPPFMFEDKINNI